MDAYEAQRCGFDAGGVAVSETTLGLMATFPPSDKAPAQVVRRFALSLMDDRLLDAFDYPHPSALERWAFRGAVKARGRALRHFPARREPWRFADMAQMRSYPDGYRIEELGSFPHDRSDAQ